MASENNGPGNRLIGLFGLLATLTGIVAVLRTDRASAVVAFVVIVLTLAGIGTARVWRAQTEGGARRYPRGRYAVATALTMVVVAGAVALIIPATRQKVIQDLLGLGAPEAGVRIVDVSVARAADAYRMEIAVLNEGLSEVLSRKVEILLRMRKNAGTTDEPQWASINGCDTGTACTAKDPTFAMMSEIRVDTTGAASISGEVSEVQDDGTPGKFVKPIKGTAVCNVGPTLSLVLPVVVALQPGRHTQISIVMPKSQLAKAAKVIDLVSCRCV